MTRTVQFSAAPFTADKVDTVNAVIRGVSVLTSGLIAKGHDLEVDSVTLGQMLNCAKARGQIPVKVDHKSGAAAVCGFLSGFRIEGKKLLADWFLLQSHPQTAQILETVTRMPRGVGLSASFISPENAEPGKARCQELVSVDYVTLPAANPDGMFAAKDARRERLTALDKVRRAISAAGQGFGAGAAGGVAANGLLPRARYVRRLPASAALAGGLLAGAAQIRRDRDFAATADVVRLRQSVARNVSVPVPGADTVDTVRTAAKKPLVRKIAVKAAKVGVGALAGYHIGRRLGAKAGAVSGALAGALFSTKQNHQTMNTVEKTVLRHFGDFPSRAFESHSFDSLTRRISAPRAVVTKLLANGVLRSRGPVHRGDECGLHSFSSDDLNAVRFSVLSAVAEGAKNAGSVDMALRAHLKTFEAKPSAKRELSRFPKGLVQFSRHPDDDPGIVRRTASAVGKAAAIGAVGYGAASYLRGRALKPTGSLLDKLRAGHTANVGTLSEGARRVAAVLANSRRR